MRRAASHPRLHALRLAAAIWATAAAHAQQDGARPYAETVTVVESSVVVELPANRPYAEADDITVLEAGALREVIRVEALGSEDPWELLIWVDTALCREESLAPTLLALARHAEQLTRLGRVRVAIAGERVAFEVEGTREPALLLQALADLSRQDVCGDRVSSLLWEARRSDTPEGAEAVLGRLTALVGARARLLAETTGPCPHDACAVLLVAHGYPLELDLAIPERLRSRGQGALAVTLADATAALGRRLAVARWLLVALPLEPPPARGFDGVLPPAARPGPDPLPPERGGYPFPYSLDDGNDDLLMVRVWPRGRKVRARTDALPASAWDLFLLPDLAPLRELADGTGGMVLRVAEQLAPAMADLGRRTRVWYRTTPLAPGEVRVLEVLVGSPARRALAPGWVGLAEPAPAPR
jgi:hypothetical protein